jgi:type VI secretion system protein ImpJ
MSSNDRVVWTEGMFLRPQHFQQQDRFFNSRINSSSKGLQSYRWGFSQLEIDQDLLKVGKLALRKCQGILPDGLAFNIQDKDLILDLPEGTREQFLYLCLPVSKSTTCEFSESEEDHHVRYRMANSEVKDNTDQAGEQAQLQVGTARFLLALENEELDAYQSLAVARIVEVGADRNVLLDHDFIPPTLDSNAQPLLRGMLVEVEGMLHQRAQSLAGNVSGTGRSSTEISAFLLLQAINRIEPLVHHLVKLPDLHPEVLYQHFIQIAGELSTFTSKERRPPAFSEYTQDALKETFEPVIHSLRSSMSTVLEQAATQIDLSAPNQYGIRTVMIGNKEMLKKAMFVLAVRTDIPDEMLRSSLPGHIKVGAVEKIAQLINKALPGVGVNALPAAPRQIPFNAGTTYFQFDTSSAAWKDILLTGNLAMHIAGQYPGLDMTFWAVRQ